MYLSPVPEPSAPLCGTMLLTCKDVTSKAKKQIWLLNDSSLHLLTLTARDNVALAALRGLHDGHAGLTHQLHIPGGEDLSGPRV